MKKSISKLWQKLLTLILSALGLSSCTPGDNYRGFVAMYGMPANWAEVGGCVTSTRDENEDGNKDPIEGIRVRALDSDGMEIVFERTGENGAYFLQTSSLGSEITVVFEDVDGEENGSFKEKRVKVKLENTITELNVELEDADAEEAK